MALGKKAFYAKFVRGQDPKPEKVAVIRVDYDPPSGEPIQASVVAILDPQMPGKIPEAFDIESISPSPTGLCSWTYLALPRMVMARQPWLIRKDEAQTAQPKRKPGRPKKQPVSIASGQAIPSDEDDPEALYDFNPDNYCSFCGHIQGGNHELECDKHES